MDVYLSYGGLTFAFIGIPIILGLLLYFIPKKLGYPKIGKYLTVCFGLFVLAITLVMMFGDQLFTKHDAQKLLIEQNIVLKDDFAVASNESSSVGSDYSHTFVLNISEQDRLNISKEMQNSPDFKTHGMLIISDLPSMVDRYSGPKRIQIYETDNDYVRECFEPSGQQGYAPTFRIISINKNENKLIFQEIDE